MLSFSDGSSVGKFLLVKAPLATGNVIIPKIRKEKKKT